MNGQNTAKNTAQNTAKNPIEEQLKEEYRTYAAKTDETYNAWQDGLLDFASGKIDRRTLDLLHSAFDYFRGLFDHTNRLLTKHFPDTARALYNELLGVWEKQQYNNRKENEQ